MFKKTRNKIIISIMLGVMLFFILSMLIIYITSAKDIRRRDMRMLDVYISRYDPEAIHPSGAPLPYDRAPSDNSPPPHRLSIFYYVSFDNDGNVIAIDNQIEGTITDGELEEYARKILERKSESGKYGNLLYKVSREQDHTLVAFLDNAVLTDTTLLVLRNMLIIGGIFTVAVYLLALFLSSRIVKPLEKNDKWQRQFISDAGHELKTPLAIISTNADLLGREIGESKWLDNIKFENKKMGDLVEQLLYISRVGSVKVVDKKLNMSNLVTEQVLIYDSVAYERGAVIESDICEELNVLGDETWFSRLVAILLDNALSHMSGDKVVNVKLERNHRKVVLSVINSSEPVSAEEQEKIFERFYRKDDSRNSSGDHYGLGLPIAKEIVNYAGGEIGCRFKDGKACFFVKFKEVE